MGNRRAHLLCCMYIKLVGLCDLWTLVLGLVGIRESISQCAWFETLRVVVLGIQVCQNTNPVCILLFSLVCKQCLMLISDRQIYLYNREKRSREQEPSKWYLPTLRMITKACRKHSWVLTQGCRMCLMGFQNPLYLPEILSLMNEWLFDILARTYMYNGEHRLFWVYHLFTDPGEN